MPPIKVMIVDDSAVVRQVLSATLGEDHAIEIIGTAVDPVFALERMKTCWPDVIVLDVEMPRMDGITFLRKIMAERPTPVVICSTLTEKGSETALQALSAGAVCVVTKPRMGLKQFLMDSSDDLVSAVKVAARANVRRLLAASQAAPMPPAPKLSADAILPPGTAMAQTTETVVAIGTSTGGTQALEAVLRALPRVCPGIVVVQHMPEKFTGAFAQRLDTLCEVEVREARHGDRGGARSGADRTGRSPHASQAQWRPVCGGCGRRSAGESPPTFGGRPVPVCCPLCGQERGGHHHDRDG
jgi:two-component system chemotaxis response regulator CheB